MSKLLDEREKTHGDYNITSKITQAIKAIYAESPNWGHLNAAQKESLEMDALKTARILSGNPNEPDHWADKVGYSKLIVKSLEKTNFRVKLNIKKEKNQ